MSDQSSPEQAMTIRPSHAAHVDHSEGDDQTTSPAPNGPAALAAHGHVSQEARFNDYRTYMSRELPANYGKYDALTARNIHVYGRVISERGNDGLAYSIIPENEREEKVIAIAFVNNHTAGALRPHINQLIAREFEKPIELSVQIRGPILNGLGMLGEFKGMPPFATYAEREAAVNLLTVSNPRVGNLVGRYGAVLDVSQGTHRSFLNNISVRVKDLPNVIRDLSESNTSNNTQHVGAFRLAQVLEATMRQFAHDGLISQNDTPIHPIAVDRYAKGRQAAAAAVVAEPATYAGANQESSAGIADDEPPF